MSAETLRERVLAELEEIRGRREGAELEDLRRYSGYFLLDMDSDLLREIADMRDRVRAAYRAAETDDPDTISNPPRESPRHPENPLFPEYEALDDLSLFSAARSLDHYRALMAEGEDDAGEAA